MHMYMHKKPANKILLMNSADSDASIILKTIPSIQQYTCICNNMPDSNYRDVPSVVALQILAWNVAREDSYNFCDL